MRKVRDELLDDGPARVQKSLSPAVRAALESLVKAQAERAAQIEKLIKRIRVTEPYTTCCMTCSRAYTAREFDELGGECASAECDSYLKHLTPAGIEKANRGRWPVTIAPADDEADQEAAKAGAADSG